MICLNKSRQDFISHIKLVQDACVSRYSQDGNGLSGSVGPHRQIRGELKALERKGDHQFMTSILMKQKAIGLKSIQGCTYSRVTILVPVAGTIETKSVGGFHPKLST